MHGDGLHVGNGPARIVCSSSRVGSRQSHCPMKHPPALSSDARKPVKSVPSPGPVFTPLSQRKFALPSAHHVYLLSASCGSAPFGVESRLVFFSHSSAVRLSVTVVPLST